MSTLFIVLCLCLAFSFGVLCTLGAFYLVDQRIRRRHNLRTEADVDAALRRYETAQSVQPPSVWLAYELQDAQTATQDGAL